MDAVAVSDPLSQNRFNAARREIERQPCLKPLRATAWTTAEKLDPDPTKRWRHTGNGVFWLVGE